jgi:hypothetical protein
MFGFSSQKSAEIAQLVEHATENRGVPSSILGLGTSAEADNCGRGSVVERLLAKEKIEGPNPFARSVQTPRKRGVFFRATGQPLRSGGLYGRQIIGDVAKW